VGGAAEWIAGLGLRWVLVQAGSDREVGVGLGGSSIVESDWGPVKAGSDKEVIVGARFVFGAGAVDLEANPR
jgi:hypothetical protein